MDITLAYPGGLCLGMHVTQVCLCRTSVSNNQLGDILTEDTTIPKLDRHHAKTFAKMLLGVNVKGTRHRATNIGPVAHRHCEGNQLVLGEDRAHNPDVIEMSTTRIRIIHTKNISRVNITFESLQNCLGSKMQRAYVHSDILTALHNSVALCVNQRAGEVTCINDE